MPSEPSKALTGPLTVTLRDTNRATLSQDRPMMGRVLGIYGWALDWAPTVADPGTVTNPIPGQIIVVPGTGPLQWDGTKWVPYKPPRLQMAARMAPIADRAPANPGPSLLARLATFPPVYREFGKTIIVTKPRPTTGQLYPLGDR